MKNELLYIRNSGYFKSYLNKIAASKEYNKMVVKMTKRITRKMCDYWKTPLKLRNGLRKSVLFQPPKCRKDNKHGKTFL